MKKKELLERILRLETRMQSLETEVNKNRRDMTDLQNLTANRLENFHKLISADIRILPSQYHKDDFKIMEPPRKKSLFERLFK